MDLNDKAAKAITKAIECLSNNIEDIEVEFVPEDFKLEVNYTIRPVHALRCIEIKIPFYNKARCFKTLRTRRRYFSFNSKWKTWYDFDSRSKYIMTDVKK